MVFAAVVVAAVVFAAVVVAAVVFAAVVFTGAFRATAGFVAGDAVVPSPLAPSDVDGVAASRGSEDAAAASDTPVVASPSEADTTFLARGAGRERGAGPAGACGVSTDGVRSGLSGMSSFMSAVTVTT